MPNLKLISVIIPCRNEEKFLTKCLDSVINNDYPKENLEILVVDGASTDNTKKIAQEYARKYNLIKVLDNSKKYVPSGMNMGIMVAHGEIIIRMDAHAEYKEDYISKCVHYLNSPEYGADNVGGVLKTLPANNTLTARAIAFSLSSVFGAGNSVFRVGVSKPTFVDTVFGGCYRKEIFSRIGLYNENLIRSQDMELNLRLKRMGGKILLVPDIIATYYPKSTLKEFFLHNLEDGIWSVYLIKFTKIPLSLRHYIPMGFMLALLLTFVLGLFSNSLQNIFRIILGMYLIALIYFSLRISKKENRPALFVILPMVFAARHFGYGIGSLWGLIKLYKK